MPLFWDLIEPDITGESKWLLRWGQPWGRLSKDVLRSADGDGEMG